MDAWGKKWNDFEGTCEAYVEIEFGGAKIKTRAVVADKRWHQAYWFEDIFIPVSIPCVST